MGVCLRIVHLYASFLIILPDEEALEQGFAWQVGIHVGGCQNYGPFLDPFCNTAPNIWVPKKGP